MSTYAVRCPSCDGKFNLTPDQLGRALRCARCKHTFTAPTADQVPAEAPPAPPPEIGLPKDADTSSPTYRISGVPRSAAGPARSPEPPPEDREPPAPPPPPTRREPVDRREPPRRPRTRRDDSDRPKPKSPPRTATVWVVGVAVAALIGLAAIVGAVFFVIDAVKQTKVFAQRPPENPQPAPAFDPGPAFAVPEPNVRAGRPAPVGFDPLPPVAQAPAAPPDAAPPVVDVPNPKPKAKANPFRPPAPKKEQEPPPAAIPAPVPVPITPPARDADRTEVKLPAPAADACVGGGGRFLFLHLPQARQIAVFDVSAAKLVKFIPVPADEVRIAAGMNKLFVTLPETNAVARYDLGTFTREVTAPLAIQGRLAYVGIGSASAGPLIVCTGDHTRGGSVDGLYDPVTFRKLNVAWENEPGLTVTPAFLRASADGTVFAAHAGHGGEPHALKTIVRTGARVRVGGTWPAGSSIGVPGPDGKYLYCADGVFTPLDMKRVLPKGNDRGSYLPSSDPALFLRLEPGADGKGGRLSVHTTGDDRPLARLTGIDGVKNEEIGYGTAKDPFHHDKRVHFIPQANLIVTVPPTNDRLILHKFDLDEALEKSGIDYLFVTSRPPPAVAGAKFDYRIKAKSKKGGVKFKLEAGPDGMTVSPDGRVEWAVPAAFAESPTVIVTVSDKSGQETFHSFTLSASGGGAAVAAAPPEPTPAPARKPRPVRPATPPPVAAGSGGIVRPPENPLPITPTKAADGAVVRLPAAADRTCLGGGGRFVVLRLPQARQLAVFDVSAGKVARYLPLAEDGALFAAGMDKLYVVNPLANVIQRWSLTSFEKDLTAPNPLGGTPKQVLMGHSTDGPLYIGGQGVGQSSFGFVDGRTMKPVDTPPGTGGRGGPGVGDHYPPTVRVSGDGRVYTFWTPGLSPSGLNSWVIGHTSAKGYNEHTSVGPILPGPDGTLFTGAGLYTPELKPIGEKKGYQYWFFVPIPAAHGPAYLNVRNDDLPGRSGKSAGGRVSVKLRGDDRQLVVLPDLAGLDVPASNNNTTPGAGLPLYDRVFLVPQAKALVALAGTGDALHVHRFDLKELLDRSGTDYLLVMSRPPAAVRGKKFTYTPEVWSKKGGVTLRVDAGPDGMKAAGDTVEWNVPADALTGEGQQVILTIADAAGQETFHSFTLVVADP